MSLQLLTVAGTPFTITVLLLCVEPNPVPVAVTEAAFVGEPVERVIHIENRVEINGFDEL